MPASCASACVGKSVTTQRSFSSSMSPRGLFRFWSDCCFEGSTFASARVLLGEWMLIWASEPS